MYSGESLTAFLHFLRWRVKPLHSKAYWVLTTPTAVVTPAVWLVQLSLFWSHALLVAEGDRSTVSYLACWLPIGKELCDKFISASHSLVFTFSSPNFII